MQICAATFIAAAPATIPPTSAATPWHVPLFLAKYAYLTVRRRPVLVHFEVTMRCNARCGFCDYWKTDPAERKNEVKSFVDSYLRRGRETEVKSISGVNPADGGFAVPRQIDLAIAAAEDKQAQKLVVLDLRKSAGFTDYFLIASGTNTRQVRAIARDGAAVSANGPAGARLPGLPAGIDASSGGRASAE